jgi:hypothetical protein
MLRLSDGASLTLVGGDGDLTSLSSRAALFVARGHHAALPDHYVSGDNGASSI